MVGFEQEERFSFLLFASLSLSFCVYILWYYKQSLITSHHNIQPAQTHMQAGRIEWKWKRKTAWAEMYIVLILIKKRDYRFVWCDSTDWQCTLFSLLNISKTTRRYDDTERALSARWSALNGSQAYRHRAAKCTESSCSVAQSSQHHPHLRHKYMAHCKRTELHIYYLYESKWSCRRTSSQLLRRAVKKLSKQRSERSSRSRLARSSAHVSIWTLWASTKDDSQRRLYRWYKLSFAWDLLTWEKNAIKVNLATTLTSAPLGAASFQFNCHSSLARRALSWTWPKVFLVFLPRMSS